MLGKHHISISLGTALALSAPWFLTDTISVVSLLIGTIIGSLLPDTDANDSKIHYMDGIARFFGAIMEPVVFPITKKTYQIFHLKFNPKHRGSMHTLLGVFVYSSILAIIVFVGLMILGLWNNFVIFFILGLFLGGILHIAEDCCTKSGITPLKPFNKKWFGGKISTNNRFDKRPSYFADFLIILAVGVMFAEQYYKYEPLAMAPFALIGLTLSWIAFYGISQGEGPSKHPPHYRNRPKRTPIFSPPHDVKRKKRETNIHKRSHDSQFNGYDPNDIFKIPDLKLPDLTEGFREPKLDFDVKVPDVKLPDFNIELNEPNFDDLMNDPFDSPKKRKSTRKKTNTRRKRGKK